MQIKQFTAYKSKEIASKYAKITQVQKKVKNLISEWNQKKKNNTSSHMLLDHCYAFGLLL